MSTVGPSRPTSVAEDMSAGSASTATLTNLTDADGSTETGNISSNGVNSYYVVLTGYGFAVPSGATIDGITVTLRGRRTGPGGSFPHVYLVKGGAVQTGGSDKPIANATLTTSLADYTLGSSVDLWGNTWTDTDTNASNFGVAFQGIQFAMGGSRASDVQITIDYTAAGGAAISASRRIPIII